MKKVFKYGCLGFIILFVSLMILGYFFVEEDSTKEETEEVVKLKAWEEQSLDEKKESIKLFINAKGEPHSTQNFRLRGVVVQALSSLVKYPETLEFKDLYDNREWVHAEDMSAAITKASFFGVNDYEKGILTLKVPFRSESSAGLKIRKELTFQFQYNATESFKSLDANIE